MQRLMWIQYTIQYTIYIIQNTIYIFANTLIYINLNLNS